MGPINAEIEIDASREAAFELLADLARRPTFTDHFLTGFHLTRIDARGEGAGARFRVEAPLRSPWEDTTLVALEEPFKLEERGAGGRSMTRVRLTHWTAPTEPIDKLVESLSWGAHFQRKGWKRALERLRDILEAEGPGGERIAVAGGNRYATGIP